MAFLDLQEELSDMFSLNRWDDMVVKLDRQRVKWQDKTAKRRALGNIFDRMKEAESARRRHERLRDDPEYKAKKKAWDHARYLRTKGENKARHKRTYAKYKETSKKNARKRYELKKNDPEFKAKQYEAAKRWWAKLKADPVRLAAYQAKYGSKARYYRKKKNALRSK